MKRVLFDENMPRKLRRDLSEFSVRTAQEQGWSSVRNGELLRLASESFDVLVTIDQRMRYQQNVPRFSIGVVVIEVPDTRLIHLRPLVPQLREAIETSNGTSHSCNGGLTSRRASPFLPFAQSKALRTGEGRIR